MKQMCVLITHCLKPLGTLSFRKPKMSSEYFNTINTKMLLNIKSDNDLGYKSKNAKNEN